MTRKRAPYGEPAFICSSKIRKGNTMFDRALPTPAMRFLTVREGWFLGYPVIGEAPMQLIQARPPSAYSRWEFITRDSLTADEWHRLATANYCHWYLLAGGHTKDTSLQTEWMLLYGKPCAAAHSTLRHVKPITEVAGSGIGV